MAFCKTDSGHARPARPTCQIAPANERRYLSRTPPGQARTRGVRATE